LKGEKPQDLPAVQPNQVQLMKVLDIEAPANILALAAEVIFRVWHLSDVAGVADDVRS
jgi:hypothetical protein